MQVTNSHIEYLWLWFLFDPLKGLLQTFIELFLFNQNKDNYLNSHFSKIISYALVIEKNIFTTAEKLIDFSCVIIIQRALFLANNKEVTF